MDKKNNEERAKEFVENLGHGKSMVEIEQEEAENEKGEFEEQCRVYAEKRKAIEDFNSKVKESTMTIDTEIKKYPGELTIIPLKADDVLKEDFIL